MNGLSSLSHANIEERVLQARYFCYSKLIPFISLLIGVRYLYVGSLALLGAQESIDWPTTKGVIVQSNIQQFLNSKKKKDI